MITFSDIQLLRGGKPLLDQASATIHPGDKVGLVGKNGCGKSTLFALLKDGLSIDAGTFHKPSQWELAWVAQETPALERKAIEYVIDGDREFRDLEDQLAKAELQDNGTLVAELHGKIEVIGGYTIKARAAELLDGLGFSQEQMEWSLTQFSGGWRMRLNLAQALLCRSDLLLLDEPTNHLDLDAVMWLERWLQTYPGTLILISHDRDFLDPIVGRIIHIENQLLNEYTGNYSSFENQRAQKLILQQAMYQKQQKQMAHMQSYIDRFRYKASKARQAQSRIKALEKMEKVLPAQFDNPFSFEFREPAALPNPILMMDEVSAGYGENLILEKIRLNLVPGSRIGLLGRNGAGKSTLIKLLSGELKSQSGEFTYSQGVKIGYFAQHQLETLHPEETPLQHMMQIAPDKTEQQLRDYLGSFGFQGDKALEKVAPFSGGEKARLVLALIVWQKPNLLLLDEPTNHLDLDMRQALTLALQTFEGAMVIVSHDRYLLRATTDDLYLVHDRQVAPFDGDLNDYYKWLTEQQKAERKELQASAPEKSSDNSAAARKEQKRKEAEFRKLTAPIRKNLTKLEQKMDKLGQILSDTETQLSDTELYQAENKAKLNEVLSQQATAKSELEEVEMEWMAEQETLEQMELEMK
ncbi:putative Glutathione-regulated potassium-efflux system ATP-binding protein [Vibrio nigripulchritudo SO65]|uniref:ABC transporter ATP-binding protein n=1 Tax=Vibrio nigripulchritudo TaxID=28173 RepID=UPI0003B1DE87|nr:ABC transporter ATP-binding protein [Vibrio nigripulchritudo]CCN33158.1 putative Glutathione-regulated potassium-efflux system ATP-binding protein [Vibrio nigripulchritudo AM115]CCN42775.1 putative Glutathione-regulated potassium-efflux system ATP-binding protein [Vibrio nigripulchritudo FTn2]CCN67509.1 putative Glutathione-regulated potassium-efflux system ATP-binding protein [Vibrio nigripulchritudo POn4]CCN74208.1 putative Glutathione-regulated potassium-efflux system ATP-binding protein 